MSACFVIALVLLFVGASKGQSDASECPPPWISHSSSCYRFSIFGLIWEDALLACQKDDAYLVAVEDEKEHLFVQASLRAMDDRTIKHMWYTGGREVNGTLDANPAFEWVGVKAVSQADQFWSDLDSAIDPSGNYIVYAYDDQNKHKDDPSWFWLKQNGTSAYPYICEVKKIDAGKIQSAARDFTFGIDTINQRFVLRGPYFVQQPTSVIYDRSVAASIHIGSVTQAPSPNTTVVMECDARGYPPPSYFWMRESDGNESMLSSPSNNRYVTINGRLIIYSPQSADDGQYYCIASNSLGVIRSNSARLTVQQINEFPRETQTYNAQASNYFIMPCKHNNPPSTRLSFFWYLNQDPSQSINTGFYPHMFSSSNGNLYFSHVTTADSIIYNCQAGLYDSLDQKRTSPTYSLRVSGDTSGITVPVTIDSSFPKVFPTNPFIGETVQLECWARGTALKYHSFNYRWTRDGLKSLSSNSELSDYGRVLTIYNAQFEDQGAYRCNVFYNNRQDSRVVILSLQSIPFFGLGGLLDMHADVGTDITWSCIADGNPAPTYSWLKNNQPFSPETLSAADKRRVDFSSDMTYVRFKLLDSTRDPGMYQCAATNVYGTTYSSAQLRVLEFSPRFTKHSAFGLVVGTIGSNATMPCNPEGAPKPVKQWRVNGVLVNPALPGHRMRLLPNGDLFLQSIVLADAGNYSCTATNSLGSVSISTTLTVLDFKSIRIPAVVNTATNSVTVDCASYISNFPGVRYSWAAQLNYSLPSYSLVNSSSSYFTLMRGQSGVLVCIASSNTTIDTVNVTFTVTNKLYLTSNACYCGALYWIIGSALCAAVVMNTAVLGDL